MDLNTQGNVKKTQVKDMKVITEEEQRQAVEKTIQDARGENFKNETRLETHSLHKN